jgi:hypothetical protein
MSLPQRPTETFLPPFVLYGQFSSFPRAPELISAKCGHSPAKTLFTHGQTSLFFPYHADISAWYGMVLRGKDIPCVVSFWWRDDACGRGLGRSSSSQRDIRVGPGHPRARRAFLET